MDPNRVWNNPLIAEYQPRIEEQTKSVVKILGEEEKNSVARLSQNKMMATDRQLALASSLLNPKDITTTAGPARQTATTSSSRGLAKQPPRGSSVFPPRSKMVFLLWINSLVDSFSLTNDKQQTENTNDYI